MFCFSLNVTRFSKWLRYGAVRFLVLQITLCKITQISPNFVFIFLTKVCKKRTETLHAISFRNSGNPKSVKT